MDPLYTGSMFITSLSSGALAVWAKAKDNPGLTRVWRALLLLIALWSLGRAGLGMATTHGFGLVAVRFSYAASSWMGLLYVILCGDLVKRELPRLVVWVWGGLCAFLSTAALTPLLIADVTEKLTFRFYDVPGGIVFHLFSAQYTVGIILGIGLLIFGMQKEHGVARNRMRYVFLASVLGFTASWTTFPLVNNVQMYPFGVPLIASYPVLLTYGVVKHHVMDVNLAFRYGTTWVAYVFMGIVLSIGPFVLFGANPTPEWLVSSLLAVGGGPFLFHFTMPAITSLVDRLPWFSGRYLSRHAVQEVLAPLQAVDTLDQLPWAIVERVRSLVPARSCNVLLKDAGKPRFLIKGHFGLDPGQAIFLSVPSDSPLVHHLTNEGTACVAEYLGNGTNGPGPNDAVLKEMKLIEAAVTLPIFFRGELHAIVNIAERIDGRSYNDLDIGHLNELARRSEHRMETLVAGLTHQQLTSMWAHDLVKPFGPKGSMHIVGLAIEGTFGMIPPKLKQALETVLEDVEFVRTNLHQVMKPNEMNMFQIASCVIAAPYESIRRKFTVAAAEQGLNWVVDEPPDSVKVLCDRAIIEHRVLANLVENAFRHTPKGGTVTLGYSLEDKEFIGFVQDTGAGIREEDIPKLFQLGVQLHENQRGLAGLGLASVRSVIESHRGRIWVESKWGTGTRFYFSLRLDNKLKK